MKRFWMKTPEEQAAEKARIAENLRCLGKMAESGMGMTCGQCGHFDERGKVYPSGFVAPGEVALVPCAAVL